MFLFSALQAYQWNFLRQRMNGAAFRSADLSAFDIRAVASTHGLVPEYRRQKLSTGQALQHRQGKEESKNVG
jgi:hypothetical protein